MAGLFEDQLISDTAVSPSQDSSFITPPSSGIGLGKATVAPPILPSVKSRVGDDLQNLPAIGKLGLALQSFGAGVTGQPNPIDIMMKQKREERLTQMNEFRAHLLALEDGIKMSERLRGPDRQSFADSYAARLDQVNPGLGNTFKALHKRPDISKMLGKYSDIPMAQMSLAADPSGQNFLKMLSTTEGMKLAEKQLDSKALPIVIEKVKSIYKNLQQLVPKEMVDKFNKDGVFSESEALTANDHIKDKFPKLALDQSQLEVLRRNSDDVFMPLGIVTAKIEQGVLKKRLENKGDLLQLDLGDVTKVVRKGDIPDAGLTLRKGLTPGQSESNRLRAEELKMSRARLAQAERFHADNIAQGKYSNPIELSIDGKNIIVVQDKKTARLLDEKGKDVTALVAPKITGSPMEPGRISMALQAASDINDAETLLFDKDGDLNRGLIAKMDVPGTRGLGSDARKAYTAIENAVAAKLRGETGAATNPGEIENTAARFRPTIMDTADSAKFKIDRLREFMIMTLDQLKESNHISASTYQKARGLRSTNRAVGATQESALDMPAKASDAIVGKFYKTSRGVARWNGTTFDQPEK